ncbi:MAG: hypothetical protein B7Y23_02795 [Sulfurovum sp. 16-42-52]|nr:MAG: hypothetical protein B7Y23_02795 [Sulfurovum sp. 16-42-52]OZA46172.1 MAG: hypothetical protein B7X80_03225 [Sulfurovum sp. 17-42-90]
MSEEIVENITENKNKKIQTLFYISILIVVLIAVFKIVNYQVPVQVEKVNNKYFEGAFGLKLGDTYDVSKNSLSRVEVEDIIKKNLPFYDEEEYIKSYYIVPPKPLEYFSQYSISIDPQSHKIFEIIGSKDYQTYEECRSKYKILEQVIENKYCKVITPLKNIFQMTKEEIEEASKPKDCEAKSTDYGIHIVVADREIFLGCDNLTLSIKYSTTNGYKVAYEAYLELIQTKRNLEARKIDNSSL